MKASFLLLTIGVSIAGAEMVERTWHSEWLYANVPFGNPSGNGVDGYGWQVDIALAGSSPVYPSLVENAGTSVNYGWYDGSGYYVGGFQFDAVEGQTVVMRIWNDASFGTLTLDSLPLTLPDIEGEEEPGDTNIQFEFHPESFWGWPGVSLVQRSNHGKPVKCQLGTGFIGDPWFCEINSPVEENGGRYVCTGWVGTGDVPASGGTTNTGEIFLTLHSSITWLLETNAFRLDTSITGNGSLNVDDGWYDVGSNLLLTATPASGWVFTGWSGDLTGDASTDSANILMSEAKNISASFAPEGDLDFDGMDDAWEVAQFGSVEAGDPAGDPDGDLYLNLEEFRNGTDPNVWDIYVWLSGELDLFWKTVPGTNYQSQANTDLVSGAWTNWGAAVAGDGSTNAVHESITNAMARYYRVITPQGAVSANTVGYVKEPIGAGGSFKIISLNPLRTGDIDIQGVFANLDVLNAGGNRAYADADKMYVWTGSGYDTYGLYDAGGSNYWMSSLSAGWRRASKARPASRLIRRGQSAWYETGVGGSAAELLAIGDVPDDGSATIDVNRFGLISYPYSSTINLQNLIVSNATASATLSDADKIYVWTGSGYELFGLYDFGYTNFWANSLLSGWPKGFVKPSPSDREIELGTGVWYESVDGGKSIGFTQNYLLEP